MDDLGTTVLWYSEAVDFSLKILRRVHLWHGLLTDGISHIVS